MQNLLWKSRCGECSNKQVELIGRQCKTKQCSSGSVNTGDGCVKCEETCATCSSKMASNCLSCSKGSTKIIK